MFYSNPSTFKGKNLIVSSCSCRCATHLLRLQHPILRRLRSETTQTSSPPPTRKTPAGVQILQQELLAKTRAQNPRNDARKSAAVFVPDLRENVRRQVEPRSSRARSHERQAVRLSVLWQGLQIQISSQASRGVAHGGAAIFVPTVLEVFLQEASTEEAPVHSRHRVRTEKSPR